MPLWHTWMGDSPGHCHPWVTEIPEPGTQPGKQGCKKKRPELRSIPRLMAEAPNHRSVYWRIWRDHTICLLFISPSHAGEYNLCVCVANTHPHNLTERMCCWANTQCDLPTLMTHCQSYFWDTLPDSKSHLPSVWSWVSLLTSLGLTFLNCIKEWIEPSYRAILRSRVNVCKAPKPREVSRIKSYQACKGVRE